MAGDEASLRDTNTRKVYLDYNATTPLAESVMATMTKVMHENWANPSSQSDSGKKAKAVIEKARSQVADMINAQPHNIVFTSGGTEANNWVIHHALRRYKDNILVVDNNIPKCHIITTNVEHDSIIKPLIREASQPRSTCINDLQCDLTILPVDPVTGHVSAAQVVSALRKDTCLVTIMMANNETGAVFPLKEIFDAVIQFWAKTWPGQSMAVLHTDAAQAIGKIPVNINDVGVDFLTIVGHKFYGPRCGALYAREPMVLTPMFAGGGQESGRRSGTENTVMIAGLGQASKLVADNLESYHKAMIKTRLYLELQLKKAFGNDVILNTKEFCGETLPNTCSISFRRSQYKGKIVLDLCKRLEASTGAACHTGDKPSGVLIASGVPPEFAINSIRLSVGRETSTENIDVAVEDLINALAKIDSSLL